MEFDYNIYWCIAPSHMLCPNNKLTSQESSKFKSILSFAMTTAVLDLDEFGEVSDHLLHTYVCVLSSFRFLWLYLIGWWGDWQFGILIASLNLLNGF